MVGGSGGMLLQKNLSVWQTVVHGLWYIVSERTRLTKLLNYVYTEGPSCLFCENIDAVLENQKPRRLLI